MDHVHAVVQGHKSHRSEKMFHIKIWRKMHLFCFNEAYSLLWTFDTHKIIYFLKAQSDSIGQARRKRCGMAAVAASKICREREKVRERERERREGRKEREKRRKKRGEKERKGEDNKRERRIRPYSLTMGVKNPLELSKDYKDTKRGGLKKAKQSRKRGRPIPKYRHYDIAYCYIIVPNKSHTLCCRRKEASVFHSTAPSPIDPVLTVQPDHCYIFFSLKIRLKIILLIIIT